MEQKRPTARDVAVRALRDRAGNVSASLDRLVKEASLEVSDRRLARELAMGAVRRHGTLRAIIRAFLTQPGKKLPVPLEEILHVALYQVIFLERIPAFAAVNEAVGQAIRFGHKRQSGLINGLLRGVARSISSRISGRCPASPEAVPVSPDSHRLLGRAVFDRPEDSPSGYLSGAYSLPEDLAERWLSARGSLAGASDLAIHSCTRPPMILRVNRLAASVDQAIASLASDGMTARPHANGLSVVLDGPVELKKLAAFADGWLQVQDPTATSVSTAARPKAGMKVLDFCAAPGTKTTHIAELMDNRGQIVAVDVSQQKLDRISENCKRMGAGIVTVMPAERIGGLAPGSFDLALVDAPCSNTGVLARRPEAKWRFAPKALARLADDQLFLVAAAAGLVRRGGKLVYSTCSIEPEECSRLAASAVRRCGSLDMIEENLTLPSGASDPLRWCDGGYCTVFAVR